MTNIYKLYNQFKHYEWGSPSLIPMFLNLENTNNGKPYAEMWMGTHSGGVSDVMQNGGKVNLSAVSGELPILFKLLAIEKPLSIQVHPDKKQALDGFIREEKSGVSLIAPERNYKDCNHKPEIICALFPVTLMAGFREPSAILGSLEKFSEMDLKFINILSPAIRALKSNSLCDFFKKLFNISKSDMEYISSCLIKNEYDKNETITEEQWNLMKSFSMMYKDDPALLSPLFLNLLTLQKGEAIFVPAGILHAYLSGFGIELMTSSDNVLRCGLTPKHIDINELTNILVFAPFKPDVIVPEKSDCFYYKTPCDEFFLYGFNSGGEEKTFAANGHCICIVTEGELITGDMVFKKGESFFISKQKNDSQLCFKGNFSLYIASVSPL